MIFNICYAFANPNYVNTLTLGAIWGLTATVISVIVIGGFQFLGSGLNTMSIKIIFGVTTILNLLFQINIGGFPIGIGLLNTVIEVFLTSGDLMGLGFIITTVLGALAMASGLLTILGSGD